MTNFKKIITPNLKDKGAITVTQILANIIKMQATSFNGRLKIAS